MLTAKTSREWNSESSSEATAVDYENHATESNIGYALKNVQNRSVAAWKIHGGISLWLILGVMATLATWYMVAQCARQLQKKTSSSMKIRFRKLSDQDPPGATCAGYYEDEQNDGQNNKQGRDKDTNIHPHPVSAPIYENVNALGFDSNIPPASALAHPNYENMPQVVNPIALPPCPKKQGSQRVLPPAKLSLSERIIKCKSEFESADKHLHAILTRRSDLFEQHAKEIQELEKQKSDLERNPMYKMALLQIERQELKRRHEVIIRQNMADGKTSSPEEQTFAERQAKLEREIMAELEVGKGILEAAMCASEKPQRGPKTMQIFSEKGKYRESLLKPDEIEAVDEVSKQLGATLNISPSAGTFKPVTDQELKQEIENVEKNFQEESERQTILKKKALDLYRLEIIELIITVYNFNKLMQQTEIRRRSEMRNLDISVKALQQRYKNKSEELKRLNESQKNSERMKGKIRVIEERIEYCKKGTTKPEFAQYYEQQLRYYYEELARLQKESLRLENHDM